jgi:hypothetical protein
MSDAAALQGALEELRGAGAARLDPVRFAVLQGISRRIGDHDAKVQQQLMAKLQAGVAEFRQRLEPVMAVQAGVASAAMTKGRSARSPLAQVNEHIRATLAAREDPAVPGEPRRAGELPNARRFRQAWAVVRTLDEVQQALARKPAQAGPLNSHALVLHSLALMQELSPDYLRRFLAYAESLQWLQQAREQLPKPRAKATAKAKAKANARMAKPAPRARGKS